MTWNRYTNRPFMPPVNTPAKMDEHTLQKHCVQWFDWQYKSLTKLLFAIPNGGLRSKAVAGKLRAEGVRKGVSDLLLSIAKHGYHGLYLETKLPTGRQSPDQKEFQLQVEAQGYMYVAYRSEEEFKSIIENYLS